MVKMPDLKRAVPMPRCRQVQFPIKRFLLVRSSWTHAFLRLRMARAPVNCLTKGFIAGGDYALISTCDLEGAPRCVDTFLLVRFVVFMDDGLHNLLGSFRHLGDPVAAAIGLRQQTKIAAPVECFSFLV